MKKKNSLRCPKCGSEHEKDARFCGVCGAALPEFVQNPPQKEKKGEKRITKVVAVIVLLIAVITAGIFVCMKVMEKKAYDDSFDEAERYFEYMDYENAEAMYLKAIEIAPKEKEPYLKLVEIYKEQEDYDRIIEIAEEAQQQVDDEDKEEFEEIIDTWKDVVPYEWIVEPEIEADDIIYVPLSDCMTYSLNELKRQNPCPGAIIRLGDRYSVIGQNGKLEDELLYEQPEMWYGYCKLKRTEPKKEEMVGEWTDYVLNKDGELMMLYSVGGIPWCTGEFYYYDGKLRNMMEDAYSIETPSCAIPVRESDLPYSYEISGVWEEHLRDKYAICKDGSLVTDFIYDECGSSSEGLLAVEQNGKWGYVNEEGDVVIPIEYDASWNWYMRDVYKEGSEPEDFCFAASEGFIPLVKDGQWELRDIEGKLAIPAGVFEEICPFVSGKCWVKKDGKWGIIQIAGQEEENTNEQLGKRPILSENALNCYGSEKETFSLDGYISMEKFELLGNSYTFGIYMDGRKDEGENHPHVILFDGAVKRKVDETAWGGDKDGFFDYRTYYITSADMEAIQRGTEEGVEFVIHYGMKMLDGQIDEYQCYIFDGKKLNNKWSVQKIGNIEGLSVYENGEVIAQSGVADSTSNGERVYEQVKQKYDVSEEMFLAEQEENIVKIFRMYTEGTNLYDSANCSYEGSIIDYTNLREHEEEYGNVCIF